MKGISNVSSALMEYELFRAHSLQSQETTDTLCASESSFGTREHKCPSDVMSPGVPYCVTVSVCWGESKNTQRQNNPI